MKNVTCTTSLVVVLSAALAQATGGGHPSPPSVPANLEVPAGNKPYLAGHAIGTQNYVCLPSGSGVAWTLFGPQATLFQNDAKQLITHFLSANPAENGTPRATWQHSRDTSSIWAAATASSSDPNYVASGAIPWLLLRVLGAQYGPDGGDKLTATTFIQRVNTSGGIMPATGCAASADIGKKALVPYEAEYFFYKAKDKDDNDDDNE
jgi:hypothetical protein